MIILDSIRNYPRSFLPNCLVFYLSALYSFTPLQELEFTGKRDNALRWLSYDVVSVYKSGNETRADIDVTNSANFPTMFFSRVNSYNTVADTMLA